MTKQTYVYRQQAVDDARRLGYAGFRTWRDENGMWRASYTSSSNPGLEWLMARPAERREFVRHCECHHQDGALIPVLVVNVTKEELAEEGELVRYGKDTCLKTPDGRWFMLEPFCDELWETEKKKLERQVDDQFKERAQERRAQRNIVPGACALVHEICNSMPAASRKEILKACTDRGISPSTASTQYYRWMKTIKNGR